MVQPQNEEVEVGSEICRSCGALYHVVMRRAPMRCHDWYNCAVCGHLMMEWDSTDAPCFTLISASPGYPPRKPR